MMSDHPRHINRCIIRLQICVTAIAAEFFLDPSRACSGSEAGTGHPGHVMIDLHGFRDIALLPSVE